MKYPDLGLAIDTNDLYEKTKTSALLFNIDLHHLKKDKKQNMWAYDETTHAITNHEHPTMSIFAGTNKNVVIFKSKGMKY